jgi:hypothetical protein
MRAWLLIRNVSDFFIDVAQHFSFNRRIGTADTPGVAIHSCGEDIAPLFADFGTLPRTIF